MAEKKSSRELRIIGRFFRRSWQWLIVAALSIALGVVAYLSPGLEQADVHLDEGAIYAVNRGSSQVGMVNTQIDRVVQAAPLGDTKSRLLQHEDKVLVYGPETSTITAFNPVQNRMETPARLPSGADVRLIGPRLLVSSPQNGKVWYGNVDDVLSLDLTKDKAQFEVGVNGTAVLTTDGKIIGVNVENSELLRVVDGEVQAKKLPFTLQADVPGLAQVSAVGDDAVVLDRSSGQIWVEGMSQAFEVSGGNNAVLLDPVDQIMGGTENLRAVYATEAGLIGLTPDGPKSLSGSLQASPIAPVQVGECIYGLFGGRLVKRCADSEPQLMDLPGYEAAAGDDFSFQVNRRSVAINEQATGRTWLVEPELRMADGWQDFVKKENKNDEIPPKIEPVPPPREENKPPVAKDDNLAARAGRATVLNLLDNDSDPNGDVLTIRVGDDLEGASLQRVRGGAGLQITIPPESKADSFSFTYEVSDGELTDTAVATVRVASSDPSKENEPPYPFHVIRPLKIPLGGSFTKRVLLDWRDPEGDPLILENAWMPEGSEVPLTFTPDGTLTYQDVGKQTGVKKIRLKVSDGTSSAEADLLVTVGEETVGPITYSDFVTARVGETITVEPLANDIGQNMTLLEVKAENCTVCKIVPDHSENRFSFSASQAGSYYLTYNVSSGPIAAGLIRVDVVAPDQGSEPIAALDVALLPPQGAVTIDPLLNDSDADGDVLVIQSFTADPSLQIELQRRHVMTIKAKKAPTSPVVAEYVVSDGKNTAHGTIVVVPTPNTGSVYPVAENDSIRVRAGSIGTARVLENDSSPLGLDLKLTKILSSQLGDNVWIDGDVIRVRMPAGSLHQQYPITYEVLDSENKRGEAVLTVTAISEDAANVAPAPAPIEDRVLSGTTTRIPIPLNDIDPNGDAVRLVGLGSGPKLGAVTQIGDGFFTYEAFPKSAGTDAFLYEVSDALGSVAYGEIRIGIAVASTTNAPPSTGSDVVTVRPNRPIQIAALANDRDLEGSPLHYPEKDAVLMNDESIKAEVLEKRDISIEPIAKPGSYSGTYRVQDQLNQESRGSILVHVDEEAPLLSPVTRTDVLGVADILDKDIVEVDVLGNDFDPDGSADQLELIVPEGAEGANPEVWVSESRKLNVRVGERMKQLRYLVRDADGNASYGVGIIPGKEDAIPIVRDPNRVPTVVAGQALSLNFDELLRGVKSDKVKLTTSDTIVATNGWAIPSSAGVEYTPDSEYVGPAAVTFEVADQLEEGDDSGKRAFVTIRVEVKRPPHKDGDDDGIQDANQAPIQLTAPLLQVSPDEGEFRLAMPALFEDPNQLSFNFETWSEQGGDAPITWRAESGNSVIVATAPVDAKRGAKKVLSGKVVNALGANRPVEVVLEVVASRQPLTVTTPDNPPEAYAGVPLTIPVTANDISHLSDKTLKVVGARVVSGEGTLEFDDNSVTITPKADTVGTLTASYSVQDATGDPDRVVDGTIRLTVTSRPNQPSPPFGGVPGDGEIRFEYQSAADNGHPVTKRIVTATSADGSVVQQECPGQNCTITGLRNGVAWTLTMVDENKLGASAPSAPSAPYTPDVRPLPPVQPVLSRGDQTLTMTWKAPSYTNPDNPGSPVTSYTLKLQDLSSGEIREQEFPVDPADSRLEYAWTGLVNGRNYQASVIASNQAGSSDESTASDAVFPVGPPKGSPSAQLSVLDNPDGGAYSLSIAPGTLDGNGDPNVSVLVVPYYQNKEHPEIGQSYKRSEGQKSITFNGLPITDVSFRLYASNLHSDRVLVGETGSAISWRRPTITMAQANGIPGNPGRIFVKVNVSNYTSDQLKEAGAYLEYSLDNKQSWRPLTAHHDGYLTENTKPGVQYNVFVRLTLKNSTNNLQSITSQPARANSMTKEPLPYNKSGVALFNRTGSSDSDYKYTWQVNYTKPTLESSGGWPVDGYSLVKQSNTSLTDSDDILQARFSGNTKITQIYVGQDGKKFTLSEDVYNVQVPSFSVRSEAKLAEISIPHSESGTKCFLTHVSGQRYPAAGQELRLEGGVTSGSIKVPSNWTIQNDGQGFARDISYHCEVNWDVRGVTKTAWTGPLRISG